MTTLIWGAKPTIAQRIHQDPAAQCLARTPPEGQINGEQQIFEKFGRRRPAKFFKNLL